MSDLLSLLPKEFGYVFAVLGLGHILNMFMIAKVGMARKKYGIKYPTLYATPKSDSEEDVKLADEFNSVQRSHQNTLEFFAPTQLLMVVNGLVSPVYAAAFGGMWVLGRFAYALGYASKGPEGRTIGFVLSTLGGLFPLIGLSFYNAWSMINQ
eukprot:TRINITY_DN11656_c0_g1_i1.p1 TRINITY_DN11656_c0_g1~~TRINITY_DN11656_c0_g1_i1.p1  ORF type:complete len:170 (-),score=35.19 TRINITY_DN11656_c0_g1_i1:18-476(-)